MGIFPSSVPLAGTDTPEVQVRKTLDRCGSLIAISVDPIWVYGPFSTVDELRAFAESRRPDAKPLHLQGWFKEGFPGA